MELREALAQVSEIRGHLARTEVFRGYRSLTVGLSSLVALATAAFQAAWLPEPTENLKRYLTLWIGAALFNVIVVGVEIWHRARIGRTALARRATIFAIEQFLPALVAGGLLTLVVALRATESAWMLPGLWALLFGLGIFASCPLLPRAVSIVGAWYLACGVLALASGDGAAALSPWIMGITFGTGQLLAAIVLHVTLERFPIRWEGTP